MKLQNIILACFLVTSYSGLVGAPVAPHLLLLFFKPHTTKFLPYSDRSIISGIYVCHKGLVALSDWNGEVRFPLQQQTSPITLVVTSAVRPVILFSNTVHHLEVADDTPAAFYELSSTKGPKQLLHWHAKRLPTAARIPDDALIIFAAPEHILIDSESIVPEAEPHILLPSFYVTTHIDLALNAFQFLKVSKFFAPVRSMFSYAPDRYATLIANS